MSPSISAIRPVQTNTSSTIPRCPGVVSQVQCPVSPKVTDEFRRSLPPHDHVDAEANAQRLQLKSGEAQMQAGLSNIEDVAFQARSAVWFIADSGARIIVVSNEKDLAHNLLRGKRPNDAGRLFMQVGGSFFERLRGRVTGTWHGTIGQYQWQQTPTQGSSFSQMTQPGSVSVDDTLLDGGAVRGYFSGSSNKITDEGAVDTHFVGSFCATPINLSFEPSLRAEISGLADPS